MYYPDQLSQLPEMFDRIDRELRTQYRLGYYPQPRPAQGLYRSIEVQASKATTRYGRRSLITQVEWPNNRRERRPHCCCIIDEHPMANSYLEVAVEAALEGGAILLAEFDHPAKISYKGEVDIVTQADRRSEQAVVTRLPDALPDSCDRGGRRRRLRNGLAIPLARGSAGWNHEFRARLPMFRGLDRTRAG